MSVFKHFEDDVFVEKAQEGELGWKSFVLVHWRQNDAVFNNFYKIDISHNTDL
jgi:hypothetical protein